MPWWLIIFVGIGVLIILLYLLWPNKEMGDWR
jgi:hypothetical protein